VSVYKRNRFGFSMADFDALPPKLRDLVRQNPPLNAGLLLIALDDGATVEEVIELTQNGKGWWLK
jgi:hypothetical protein